MDCSTSIEDLFKSSINKYLLKFSNDEINKEFANNFK